MKMYNGFIKTISFVLLVLISCKNIRKPDILTVEYPEIIQIDFTDANVDSIKLSDIAFKVEYIPLQTSDSILMNYFWDYSVTKDFLFVKHGSEVLTFDKNGLFVNSLFNAGRGPEEAHARFITVDETFGRVFVYDNNLKNVKIYDYTGHYISTINKPIAPGEYWIYSIGYFKNHLFVHTAQRPNVEYLYSCFDLSGDSIIILYRNHRKYEKSQENKAPLAPYDYHYQITDSTILFKERFSDTIFSVTDAFIQEPRYIIDLGDKKLDWLDWRDHGMFNIAGGPPYGYQVQSFIETGSFLFLVLTSFKEPLIFVFYNKNTNTTSITKNFNERPFSQIYIKNDLDGIVPFAPMNESGYMFHYDNCLYSVLEAKVFFEAYKHAPERYRQASQYLREMAPSLSLVNEFSNPVLMKVYLK